ncbi:MAG TPA: DUF418 domain-containing protein [Thermoanaerobaculia bacterium]|nr:DUF418 domain-containing protein [Thermoanaerobaculia bacterium]
MTATPAAGRLLVVDALRGFALFGVFWANLQIFAGFDYMTDENRMSLFHGRLDTVANLIERFFVENKFMGLFSFLFGISFWLFLSRVSGRETSATTLFHRRIFWLFVIGAIHGWLLWCFDILRFYALWAVLLPLFVRTPPRRLLRLALAASVLIPALVEAAAAVVSHNAAIDYDALALAAFSRGSYGEVVKANWRYDWHLTLSVGQVSYQFAIFGRLLLGLYVARVLDLENLRGHRTLLRKVLLTGGLVGVVGSSIFAGRLLAGDPHDPWLAFCREFLVQGGQLGLTLAYASAVALAFLGERRRRVVSPLAPMGQMALTWYLAQTLFGIWTFYGFPHGPALMGKVGPARLAALAVAGYAVQVVLARAWMTRFRFGPAEWCWRSLTYGKPQPFRRTVSARASVRGGAA